MAQPHPVFAVSRIAPELTHALRHRVLRPHQALAEMVYEGDDEPSSIHLAAFSEADPATPIGIVTLGIDGLPIDPRLGDYRLRGMAVDKDWQGRGVGAAIVSQAVQAVAEAGGRRVWCNARLTATGFYERCGFEPVGATFDIPGIGGHVRMVLELALKPSDRVATPNT